jgi:L-asparagine transporter-like permease
VAYLCLVRCYLPLESMRAVIRISAIMIFALGFLCLPPSPGAHPYSLTTGFSRFTESGGLLSLGGILMIVGTILFIVSFIRSSDV